MRKHNFTPETEKYLVDAEAYLIKRYGQISPDWELSIELLGDTMDMYKECLASVKANGIYNAERGIKNPLISTVKDCLSTIMKLQQKLGITPYDTAKIKQVEEDDSNLLGAIMGEDE